MPNSSEAIKSFYKRHTIIVMILSIAGAMTTLLAAYMAKDTEYEDAWFYVSAFWIVLLPLVDLYLKKKYLTR